MYKDMQRITHVCSYYSQDIVWRILWDAALKTQVS